MYVPFTNKYMWKYVICKAFCFVLDYPCLHSTLLTNTQNMFYYKCSTELSIFKFTLKEVYLNLWCWCSVFCNISFLFLYMCIVLYVTFFWPKNLLMCLGSYLTKILQNKWKNDFFVLFYSASLTIMHAHMIKISRLTMKCSAQKYLSFEYEF